MSSFIHTNRRSSMDEPLTMASHHDGMLMNPGPPALYQLKTERKYIHGTNRKVRRWTYGQRDKNKQNKVILMVGETGAGKTTLVNTMINHLQGVKFDDQEIYQITEEDIDEQTSEITVYEVFVEENPTSLIIIDTPGYGNTEGFEKDREVSEYLSRLFSEEDGIHYIDAVCFVMKASQNRISGKELYIFHSVLSLFGRDIENNIVFLLTYSDGRPTDALNVIKKAQIPCRRDGKKQPVYFIFNNQHKEKRDKQYEQIYRSSWEMGERSMNEFLKLLEENNRKSVQMTLDVLKERRQLEACVCNLKEQIIEKELKMKELNQFQEAVKDHRDNIKKCENFQFTVKTAVKEKVYTENEWWWNSYVTCCSDCEENCHEWGCWFEDDPSTCSVIKNNHCTVCTGKCHHSTHVRENKKYVTKPKIVTMTFADLKREKECSGEKPKTTFDKKIFENVSKEHERNIKELEYETKTEEKLISDLERIKNENSKHLHEAYMIITTLSLIALKADSAFTLQYLDFLIPRLNEEGKDEWVTKLEHLRKAVEEQRNKGALRHVMDYTGQKIKQSDNCLTAAMASSTYHHRRKSLDEPPEKIAGVIRVKDEFIEVYERNHPQLQKCIERLHRVMEKFVKDHRHSTYGSKLAGQMGIIFGFVTIVGLLALFTLGMSPLFAAVVAAVAAVIGVPAFITATIISEESSSYKKQQTTQWRQDTEAELEKFQEKINPMAEKMKDIHDRTKKILKEQDLICIEDIAELTAQMSKSMHANLSVISGVGRFNLLLNMMSVLKFASVLEDMDKLEEKAIDELDESEMRSKVGKIIVEMRKSIYQLQNIIGKLEKTKDKIAIY